MNNIMRTFSTFIKKVIGKNTTIANVQVFVYGLDGMHSVNHSTYVNLSDAYNAYRILKETLLHTYIITDSVSWNGAYQYDTLVLNGTFITIRLGNA